MRAFIKRYTIQYTLNRSERRQTMNYFNEQFNHYAKIEAAHSELIHPFSQNPTVHTMSGPDNSVPLLVRVIVQR